MRVHIGKPLWSDPENVSKEEIKSWREIKINGLILDICPSASEKKQTKANLLLCDLYLKS